VRVLHVHSGNLYGGVETFLLSLARFRAHAPSMEMSVALTSEGRIASDLREAGVKTTILGNARISRPLSVRRARRALDAVIESERPDVVVCHQAWPLALFGPVAKGRRVALVLWMHMAAGRHWLDRLAWRVRPGTIVCNSLFTASTLPASSARVEVVYAPVSLDPEHASSSSSGDAVIIQVSRMEPLKGHVVLIDALARLRDRGGWRCWLAGGAQRVHEAQYMASLRARAAAAGIGDRVEFLGDRSDVRGLLAASDIYCQPNVEPDAFGLSLIEAMAAGLPVVTSALGGATEIVDETCGVLVAPRDSVQLASELSALLDDRGRRERLGSHGPARARLLCDPASQMPRIADVLRKAAAH
jgi:glycosyltransferase involved in cell wall biosynthesis